MGRRREFDTEAVLDAAVDVFWRRGFEATSIDQLEAATGLRRQSLYGAFGDKERLFLAALRRYHERVGGSVKQALRDPDPRRGVAQMFEVIARPHDGPRPARRLLRGRQCVGRTRPI